MTEVYQPSAPNRWPGFGYVQVPGLANRLIARWLRTQRRNMREFFRQRGLTDLVLRMDQIRNSRQGMLAKNRMFQKVLDDYAQLVNGTPPVSATETSNQQAEGVAGVDVSGDGIPDTVGDAANPVRIDGSDATDSVHEVAGEADGIVVEE